jgi:hypothetical protein
VFGGPKIRRVPAGQGANPILVFRREAWRRSAPMAVGEGMFIGHSQHGAVGNRFDSIKPRLQLQLFRPSLSPSPHTLSIHAELF